MALNKEYFDQINIELVKKKYYNAAKVESVLGDISAQTQVLIAENEHLKQRLAEVESRKADIGDAVISAQALYKATLKKANDRAAEIIAQAKAQAADILEDARAEAGASRSEIQQEQVIRQVEAIFSTVRQFQQDSIEALNEQWQAFLCGICPEDIPAQPAPADMEEKISAIAREMREITGSALESK